MQYRLALSAIFAALCVNASPVAAGPPAAPAAAQAVGPTGCLMQGATVPSNIAGPWRQRQRDDGAEWHDTANQVFLAGGTYSENSDTGLRYGHWCVSQNVLIYGFDTLEHTTYRVPLGAEPMRGTMSWDGGGTGEVEIRR